MRSRVAARWATTGNAGTWSSASRRISTMSASKPTPLPPLPLIPLSLISRTRSTGSERCVAGSASQSETMPLSTRRAGWLMPTRRAHSQSHPSHSARLDDDFKTGWVIGGGIELVHDARWLLRAEALYVDLRDKRDDSRFASSCGAPMRRLCKLGRQILGCASRPELQVLARPRARTSEVANRSLSGTTGRALRRPFPFGAHLSSCCAATVAVTATAVIVIPPSQRIDGATSAGTTLISCSGG